MVTARQRAGRDGFVLATVLLLGLALTIVAHAALLLSTASLASAVGEAARASTLGTLEARLSTALDGVALAPDLAATPTAGVTTLRLTPELLRLRADSGALRREALAWLPDAAVRLSSDSVGVRVGVGLDGLTRAGIESLPGIADPCPVGVTATAALRSAHPRVGWGDDDPLRFGPLPRSEVLERVPPLPADPPVAEGAGASLGSKHFGPGVWRGWFWVEDDAEVATGARVVGRLVVGGALVVRGGGRVEGLVAAGGELTIEAGGRLRVAPCAAALAFASRRWPLVRIRPLAHSR